MSSGASSSQTVGGYFNFKLEDNSKNKSTFVFENLYTIFVKSISNPTVAELNSLMANGKKMKEALKMHGRITVPVGSKKIKIIKGDIGGNVSDDVFTYNRFYGCLGAYIYRNHESLGDIICPLAESLGIPDTKRDVYWSAGIGSYYNITDFGVIPALLELVKYSLKPNPTEDDKTFMVAAMRQTIGTSTVYDRLMSNKAKFKISYNEVLSVCKLGNNWRNRMDKCIGFLFEDIDPDVDDEL